MGKVARSSLVFFIILCLFIGCRSDNSRQKSEPAGLSLETIVSPFRPARGETVVIESTVRTAKSGPVKIEARMFIPGKGPEILSMTEVQSADPAAKKFRAGKKVEADAPEGFYTLTVAATQGRQRVVSKGSFLLGSLIGDFTILSSFPTDGLEKDMRAYFEEFQKLGGNLVIIHSVITPEKAYYPSAVCSKPAVAGSPEDRISLALKLAAEYGLTALLSVSWDMTREMPYSECLDSTRRIMSELWALYGNEPALAGFYNYQEGSGTYLVWQMREFCAAVKSHDRGLLTACAPYIDDPLLAGYLAAIDDLDIIIYQGAVMASYRKDNRRCFPYRRVKDFASLAAGATRVKNKITLSHVELFGYLEKQYAGHYLASPEDIYRQMLSAASASGPEGIVFFTYHYNIFDYAKTIPAALESRTGLTEGLKAFRLIAKTAALHSTHLGLYIPYNDWWADRWTNAVVPALDAFRSLGLSPDILPFIPRRREEVLPYYPYHPDEEQLQFLLKNRYVLVLSDIAGMQDPDSQMLKDFVEQGGVAVLFGPAIPYGDRFEREELIGGRENPAGLHPWLKIEKPWGKRTQTDRNYHLKMTRASSWQPTTATVLASFEDGGAAILANHYGQGWCFTFPLSLREAARDCPEVVGDLIDLALGEYGLKREFEVFGLNEEFDLAESSSGEARYLAIVNHGDSPRRISVSPLNLNDLETYEIKDETSGEILEVGKASNLRNLALTIPACDYVLLSVRERSPGS